MPVKQPAPQHHRQREDENALDLLTSSHRGANRLCIPQPTSPNVSQLRSLSTNSRIARAGEMLSTRSQVAIWVLTGRAYLTSPPLPARRRDESRGPVWDCGLMSGHMCFPKSRDPFELTMSQMDSVGRTRESHVIEFWCLALNQCTRVSQRSFIASRGGRLN